jgi:hypothetical protein
MECGIAKRAITVTVGRPAVGEVNAFEAKLNNERKLSMKLSAAGSSHSCQSTADLSKIAAST